VSDGPTAFASDPLGPGALRARASGGSILGTWKGAAQQDGSVPFRVAAHSREKALMPFPSRNFSFRRYLPRCFRPDGTEFEFGDFAERIEDRIG